MSTDNLSNIGSTSSLKQSVLKTYKVIFNSEPEVFIFAPGRVNLIGEHTDYSDGFVLPMAIDLGIIIAFTPTYDNHIKLFSQDFDRFLDEDIASLTRDNRNWEKYIKGVAYALLQRGFELKGFKGVVAGNLPIGAGLSSSAALEVAAAKTFVLSANIELTRIDLAQICYTAEKEWVGVNVGIMDQLISAAGETGYAVKIDCRSLATQYISLPDDVCFVVMDTMTRRELRYSDYNARHEEVETAASMLGLSVLRDANLSILNQRKAYLPQKIYKRAKHVISENERVHAFAQAMKNNDKQEMGELMNRSHQSLRDDYEVSSTELNLIVAYAQSQNCCYGARMNGAGFGGCALAMIETDELTNFTRKVRESYRSKTGIDPHIFKVKSSDGVHLIE